MKRTSLLIAVSVLLCSVYEAAADHTRFRIGGAARTSGAVRFDVHGGAGRRPQFTIGAATPSLDRVHARRAAAGFPVAVGPYGYGLGTHQPYFGMGGFSNLYNQGFIPVPPYFALHPPVYYNVPVPRTYGYSPFPYPGSVPTPEVVISDPEIIINPHIEPEAPPPAQETSAKTASAPLVIRNPFVEQPRDVRLTAVEN